MGLKFVKEFMCLRNTVIACKHNRVCCLYNSVFPSLVL